MDAGRISHASADQPLRIESRKRVNLRQGSDEGRAPRAPIEHGKSERRAVQLLTTVAVVVSCGFSMTCGWNIIRFVDARGHLHGQTGIEKIRYWEKIPALRVAALQASLTQMSNVTDVDGARKRADDLSALLSLQPMSPVNWLSLSGMRLISGQSEKEVLAALEMSWVTGPNEGSIMLQRGIFGVMLWEILSTDARGRVIADLAGAILGMPTDDNELKAANNVLATKSVDIQEELATRLKAEGISATQLLRLGL
jgi:hypothetical protein